MNRIDFYGGKSARSFDANPRPARRSKRLFIMMNRFEPVSFPVEIRRLEIGQTGYPPPAICFAKIGGDSHD